jgi:hypothetical protein
MQQQCDDAVAESPNMRFCSLACQGDEELPEDEDGDGEGGYRPEAAGGGGEGEISGRALAADDDPMVEMIMGMGFSANAAKKALHACHGNPDMAVEWIFGHMEDPKLNDPFDPNADPTDALVIAIQELAGGVEGTLAALNQQVAMGQEEGGPRQDVHAKMTEAVLALLARTDAAADARPEAKVQCARLLVRCLPSPCRGLL